MQLWRRRNIWKWVAAMLVLTGFGSLRGEIIKDDHCVLFGATLRGLMEDEFYQKICALADFVDTKTRFAGQQWSECGVAGVVR